MMIKQLPPPARELKDYRRGTRFEAQKTGTIEFGTSSITIVPCTIHDLSFTGAAIEANSPAWFPDQFRLKIDNESLCQPCQVKWRNGRQVGVVFRRPTG